MNYLFKKLSSLSLSLYLSLSSYESVVKIERLLYPLGKYEAEKNRALKHPEQLSHHIIRV